MCIYKKILAKKDLSTNQLLDFISNCKCEIVDLRYIENTCNLVIKDNFKGLNYVYTRYLWHGS